MREIFFTIIKFTFIICIINIIFGFLYFLYKEGTLVQNIIFSLCILMDIPLGTIELSFAEKNIMLFHNLINDIIFATFTAFIFYHLINPNPQIIFPQKILIRRRTSPGFTGKIALSLTIANKHGVYNKYIYDVNIKITYIYKINGAYNASTQLISHVQKVKNYNTFYYELSEFPPHFFESIKNKSSAGTIDVQLYGKYAKSLHEFMAKKTYNTSDILIANGISPKVCSKQSKFNLFYNKLYDKICNIMHCISIKINCSRNINLDIYNFCSQDEELSIREELSNYCDKKSV